VSAFESARGIEARGNAVLLPYLQEQSDGRLVLTNKGTLAKWLQESVGDVVLNKDERLFAVELKCEQRHTGNVFLEVWSNRNLESRENYAERGQNPGWMFKLRSDLLLYYFLDEDRLYSFDLFWLKRWLFGHGAQTGVLHSARFSLRRAGADQMNDTWGLLAPISALRDELPRGAIKETRVRQRALLSEAA
jgi:hypothetical protein